MPRLPTPSLERLPGGKAVASTSRRVRTLLVAGLLFVVLFALTLTLPVPYVILSPGPTLNTLGGYGADHRPIIGVRGTATADTSGHLNLTTVSVSGDHVTPVQALRGWLAHDEVVVPRAAVYPPGQSEKQTNRQNTEDFASSQDNATAAAFCQLGYPRGFGVLSVTPGGPSSGVLHPGDFFVSVAGQSATSTSTLTRVLSAQSPGARVPVVVRRDGRDTPESVTLGRPAKGRTGATLGVLVTTGCLAPFTIDLGLGNEIGGPSAGLMFALGIIDKVGHTDLTHGRFIAGTGTIDPHGKVGPIGGIALKMIAARHKGASLFLAPAGNCSDVRGATPAGLHVVKVSTLAGAVTDLRRVAAGQSVPSC